MNKLSIRDIDVRGKRVLVRVDFNVPTEERAGKIQITDDTRIRESLRTINYLRENGAKAILMSHMGRPKGQRVEEYSLRPIADYLHTLINHPVAFSRDTIGIEPEEIIANMQEGDVALLENLRLTRGRSERSEVRRSAGQARRHLCERRVRHGTSRACIDRGNHKVHQAISHGVPDGEGAEISP
jgi:phosphoglycerate kinase